MADFVQYLRTHLDKEKMKHLKTYVNLTLVFLLSLNAAGYASTQVKVDFGKRSEIPLFRSSNFIVLEVFHIEIFYVILTRCRKSTQVLYGLI